MALSNAHDLGTGISYLDNNQIIADIPEKGSEPFFRVMFRTPSMIMPDLLV